MAFSSITISAPSSASHGKVVNFGIGIKNTITEPGMIAWEYRVYCWAPDQMSESQVLYDQVVIDVGAIKVYPLSFFMPNKDAEIFVWVERLWFRVGQPAEWPYDSSKLHKVSLGVVPPLPAEWAVIGSTATIGVAREIMIAEWAVIGLTSTLSVAREITVPAEWAIIGSTATIGIAKDVTVPAWAIIGSMVSLSVKTGEVIPPPPPPPPDKAEIPWGAIAVAGGGALLLVAATKKKRKA